MNNEERRLWILNDEGLYNLYQRSGLSMRMFIKTWKDTIDDVIDNVVSGKKRAHYLEYDRSTPKGRQNPDRVVYIGSGDVGINRAMLWQDSRGWHFDGPVGWGPRHVRMSGRGPSWRGSITGAFARTLIKRAHEIGLDVRE